MQTCLPADSDFDDDQQIESKRLNYKKRNEGSFASLTAARIILKPFLFLNIHINKHFKMRIFS